MSVIKSIALAICLAWPIASAGGALSADLSRGAGTDKSPSAMTGKAKMKMKSKSAGYKSYKKSASMRSSGRKTARMYSSGKRTAKVTKSATRTAAAPTKSCGTFMYRKGGKCMDARNKKST